MPPAARITDMHTCPMVTGVVPHVGGPILPPCEPTVLIGGLPAARITDMLTCVGPPDVIAMGSPTVLIGGLMAARIGDPTVHGGVIVLGCFTVIIGEAGTPAPSAPSAPSVPSAPTLASAATPAAAAGSPGTAGAPPEPTVAELKKEVENDLKALRETQLKTGVADEAGRTALKNKLLKVVEKLDVKSPPDEAVFYSGKGMNEAASALVKNNKLVTVETLPDGKWLNDLKLYNADALGPGNADEVWERMSERYAQGASGEVKVMLNHPRAASIFNRKELPALAKNKSVTTIVLTLGGGAGGAP
ncbi:MAG: PAAR domain-containing protein [Candidatus Acidiferrum sp.]